PGNELANQSKSDDHDDTGRPLAWGELDIRRLGYTARFLPYYPPLLPISLQALRATRLADAEHTRDRCASRDHVCMRLRGLGVLPSDHLHHCRRDFSPTRDPSPRSAGASRSAMFVVHDWSGCPVSSPGTARHLEEVGCAHAGSNDGVWL